MRQDRRGPFDEALLAARLAAYPPGEFVGQESFMSATEIVSLARAAGIGPGTSVLDLCCGVAGPGRLVARTLGCHYLGVDASPSAVAIARARCSGLACRFEVARVPPVPAGRFDAVMLLETMLAFADKEALVAAVGSALPVGGRFLFTVEAGQPLTDEERIRMPDADTVWPTPLEDLLEVLARHGFVVRRQRDRTAAHRVVAESLLGTLGGEAPEISRRIGRRALDDLLTAHRLWADWLGSGRVRKHAVVAEKGPPPAVSA